MAEERLRADWWHTARLEAAVVNLFARQPVSPARFHPFEQHTRPRVNMSKQASLDLMIGCWVKGTK